MVDVWDADQNLTAARMAKPASREEGRLLYRRGVEREERLHTMRIARRFLDSGRKLGYQQPGPDLTPPGLIFLTLIIIVIIGTQEDPTWLLVCLTGVVLALLRPRQLFRTYSLAYEAEFALERQLAALASPQRKRPVSVSYSVTYHSRESR
jgi:hypothetical protein